VQVGRIDTLRRASRKKTERARGRKGVHTLQQLSKFAEEARPHQGRLRDERRLHASVKPTVNRHELAWRLTAPTPVFQTHASCKILI